MLTNTRSRLSTMSSTYFLIFQPILHLNYAKQLPEEVNGAKQIHDRLESLNKDVRTGVQVCSSLCDSCISFILSIRQFCLVTSQLSVSPQALMEM